jgi:hypothetical protein
MSGALCNACLAEAKTQLHSKPEPAVYHGLCERHRRLPTGQYLSYDFYSFPRSENISSAGQFFKTITIQSGRGSHPLADYEERMRPIVNLPFVGPTADFVFNTSMIGTGPGYCELIRQSGSEKKYKYMPIPGQLEICEDIHRAVYDLDIFNRPIVFFVHVPIPHTGIYIYLHGRLYTIGYGYIYFSETIRGLFHVPDDSDRIGVLHSPDIPLMPDKPAVIMWIGILTPYILHRLQAEMNLVTEIRFVTNEKNIELPEEGSVSPPQKVEVVMNDRTHLINFITPSRPYAGLSADNPTLNDWNCRKWAINILFGQPGIDELFANPEEPFGPQLTHYDITPIVVHDWWNAYTTRNLPKMLEVLTSVNQYFAHPNFDREWQTYLEGFDSYLRHQQRAGRVRSNVRIKNKIETRRNHRRRMNGRRKRTRRGGTTPAWYRMQVLD